MSEIHLTFPLPKGTLTSVKYILHNERVFNASLLCHPGSELLVRYSLIGCSQVILFTEFSIVQQKTA